MSKTASREIRLASHPKGIPTAANFTLARTELGPLQYQQVLVRNLFMPVITKRLTMKGLIVRDWLDRQAEFEKEVGGYFISKLAR
jgi:NADPH-dependent curcumin reductase CurA